MLIGFLGCPSSGKTTLAAKVFSSLKADGHVTEFVPEQARWYIAEKRRTFGIPKTHTVFLDDKDQYKIAMRQVIAETNLIEGTTNDTIIVTDTASFAAQFYMSEEAASEHAEMMKAQEARYDLMFHCLPIDFYMGNDANRVHDANQSRDIARKMHTHTALHSKDLRFVGGSLEERYIQVYSQILGAISRRNS